MATLRIFEPEEAGFDTLEKLRARVRSEDSSARLSATLSM